MQTQIQFLHSGKSIIINCVPTEFYQVDNVEGVSTIKTHEVYQVTQKSVNKTTNFDSVSAEHLKRDVLVLG